MTHTIMASENRTSGPVVVISAFDGFHLGHRHLLDAAVATARRLRAALTAVVLDESSAYEELMAINDRCNLVLHGGAQGVHVLGVPPKWDASTAHTIVKIIAAKVAPALAVMACRPLAEGTWRYPLSAALQAAGVPAIEVPRQLGVHGNEITSAAIAELVGAGDVASARHSLGRPFRITGPVTLGAQRGRTLGFPTANLDAPPHRVVPRNGVYAGWARVEHDRWPAAINIGIRPTFYARGGQRLIEAHLIGFDDNIYGHTIHLDLIDRVRDEQRFDSADDLQHKLSHDIAHITALLDTP